jgi:hypothetical protein
VLVVCAGEELPDGGGKRDGHGHRPIGGGGDLRRARWQGLRERRRPRVAVVHGSNGVGGGGDGGRLWWYNAETSVLSFPLYFSGGAAVLFFHNSGGSFPTV